MFDGKWIKQVWSGSSKIILTVSCLLLLRFNFKKENLPIKPNPCRNLLMSNAAMLVWRTDSEYNRAFKGKELNEWRRWN